MQAILKALDWLRHRARLRQWDSGQAWGRRGEDLAHRYLRRHGFTVVDRNYRARTGSGELDLVAWDGPALVFIEVKSRASDEFGSPAQAVDSEKRRHLQRTAREYAHRAGVPWTTVRFDVVSVIFERRPRITHLRDAFRSSTA